MGEWITTKIPLDLAKRIDSFLESEEGQIFPNKMQFISEALREKLEKDSSIKPQLDRLERDLAFLTDKLLYEETRKKLEKFGYASPKKKRQIYFDVLSVSKDRVILKDKLENRIAEIVVQGGGLFCQLCGEKVCKHTKFASNASEVSDVLLIKK